MSSLLQYKVFITPLVGKNTYGTTIDVTKDVDVSELITEKGIGKIKNQIDNGNYEFGVFTFSDITLTLLNYDGRFNDESFVSSMFKYKRDLTKVRIVFYNSRGNSTISFDGIVNDEATMQNYNKGTATFKILSYSSIFRKVGVPSGAIINGTTFSSAIKTILNVTDITSILNYDADNINVGLDLTIDDGSKFNNKTVKDALNSLLVASSSILYVDKSNNIIVSNRVENNSDPVELFGGNDVFGRENILKFSNFNNGLQRMFNSIVVNGMTTEDLTSINSLGVRQKSLSFDYITDSSKHIKIANSILDDFKLKRPEMEVTVKSEVVSKGRNYIKNGNFNLASNGDSLSGLRAGDEALDYWYIRGTNVTFDINKRIAYDAPFGEKVNYMEVKSTLGGQNDTVSQDIPDITKFIDKSVTLSFWFRSSDTSAGGVYRARLSANVTSSSINDFIGGSSALAHPTSSWTKYSRTVRIDSSTINNLDDADETGFLRVEFQKLYTDPNYFSIMNVQLEIGDEVTQFDKSQDIKILDLVKINMSSVVKPYEDNNYFPLYGVSKYGQDNYPITTSPLPIRNIDLFKVIGIFEDPKNFTTTLKLRWTGRTEKTDSVIVNTVSIISNIESKLGLSNLTYESAIIKLANNYGIEAANYLDALQKYLGMATGSSSLSIKKLFEEYAELFFNGDVSRVDNINKLLPESISDNELFLDASDSITIAHSSNSVSQWNDKSGNNRNALQADANFQPSTNTRTLNNYNVVEFFGSNKRDHMIATFGQTLSQPNTIFAVYQYDDIVDDYIYDGLNANDRHALLIEYNDNDLNLFGGVSLESNVAPDESPHISSAQFNGSSSFFRLDGSQIASGNTGSQSLGGLTVGSRYNKYGNLDGFIAEIIIFNRLLSSSEVDDVESYLSNKWGISI